MLELLLGRMWRFKEDGGAWEEVELGEVCSLITKQTGFDYSNTIKPALLKTDKNAYSFIQNKDFEGTRINFKTDYFIPIAVAQRFKKILLDSPTLLISSSGKIGNVGFFKGDKVAFSGREIAICKLKHAYNGEFIMYFFQSRLGQKCLQGNVYQSSHLNLTAENVRTLKIPLPPLPTQQKIAHLLSTLDRLIELTHQEQQLLARITRALRDQLIYKEN